MMEIISTVIYDKSRHAVVSFLKDHVKPFIIHLIDPKKVDGYVNRKSVTQTIEEIITLRWTTMLTIKGQITGQMVVVELIDNAWVHVHLLVNGKGDRMVMLLNGQHKELMMVDLGFVGDPAVFDDYLTKLNISRFEAYSHLSHYKED